jgi:hypothetical protein
MERAAPLCDCCFTEKPNAQVRVGLYPKTLKGERAIGRLSASYVMSVFREHAARDQQKIFGS